MEKLAVNGGLEAPVDAASAASAAIETRFRGVIRTADALPTLSASSRSRSCPEPAAALYRVCR